MDVRLKIAVVMSVICVLLLVCVAVDLLVVS